MNNSAIRVENLSKLYKIGARRNRHDTLRDHVMHGFKSLFSRNGRSSSLASQPSTLSGQQSAVSGHPPLVDGRSDTIWALKDVSFEVKHGEVLGIIGRNGAGKSTLLKILSRITEPTGGFAEIHGRVGSLLEVGTGFHPELTGRENIYLNAAILGMKKTEIERKFDEIVDFAEIEKFIDTPVKRYSSGMYVRLAFAVAAHLEPEILIVDEVLAVGDVVFQKKCLGKMGDVSKAGRTVLFVSHNMQAVNTLCNRGVFLNHGCIEKLGPTAQVVASYLHTTAPDSPGRMEQLWSDPQTAPGNDRIRLRRIAIKPERDDGSQLIEMTTPFRVELEYWNLVALTRMQVNFYLHTIEGAPAFVTVSSKEPNWHGKLFPKGLFRSTCYIPANLMNEGTFRIRVLFVDDCLKHLYVNEEVATFTVHDTAERETLWYGRHDGPVYPKLVWKTECVNTED